MCMCPTLQMQSGIPRVFEFDIKGSTGSSSSAHNVAFISSESTSSKRLQFDAKELVGFNKTKFEYFNCHKTGHFARECRSKGNQENRRRDTGTLNIKPNTMIGDLEKKEEPKALITPYGEGFDWTETLEYVPKPVVVEPKVVSQPKVWSDAPIIEEYESNSDDEYVIEPSKEQEKPSFAFVNTGNFEMEADPCSDYFVLPICSSYTSTVKSSKAKNEGEKTNKDTGLKTNEEPIDQEDQSFLEELERLKRQEKQANDAAEALIKELLKKLRVCLLQQSF
ncbi:ribonuclease H-like domain-containing protein [Tanacetum coccineum]